MNEQLQEVYLVKKVRAQQLSCIAPWKQLQRRLFFFPNTSFFSFSEDLKMAVLEYTFQRSELAF